ncbi:MAG: hypothetical protein MUC88_00560, partial [Planctomycetes bacterium]|nr:hypothetical protein [Planctomycetota bacterium]
LDGKDEASEDKYEKIASDPKMQPEYEFEIDYTDNRGKRWHGTFVNRILTYRMRTQVGTIRAQMNGGLPMEALDLNTLDMTEKVAHLTVSLGKRPPWAKKTAVGDGGEAVQFARSADPGPDLCGGGLA